MWAPLVVLVIGNSITSVLAYAGWWLAAIVIGLVSWMIAMALMGMRFGTRFETPDLGWGTTDVGLRAVLRAQLTPGSLGAWFGLIPFLLFVATLITMAVRG